MSQLPPLPAEMGIVMPNPRNGEMVPTPAFQRWWGEIADYIQELEQAVEDLT